VRPLPKAGLFTLAAVLALSACKDDPTGPALSCTGATPIAIGATVSGTLAQGDLTDVDGAFLDRYSLTVPESRGVEITMRSAALDSWLWLLTETGSVVAFDDDSGGGANGLDAQIVRVLDRGCYLIEATTFPGETGAYTLEVK
jgi:hypothetical protein